MNNMQPPEAPVRTGVLLSVHSIFPTIQGEGPFAGQPAVFVRLAGCNLQCPLCDTDYTSTRLAMPPDAIVRRALGLLSEGPFAASLVVITGGEPYRQPLNELVTQLLGAGFRVQIETNGTLFQELPYHRIAVVCSPKTGTVNPRLVPFIGAWKYVLKHSDIGNDGLPNHALDHPATPRLFRPRNTIDHSKIYLQPADMQDDFENAANLAAVIDQCCRHGYTLSLQQHKIIKMA